jgi:hypothetical protein
VSTGYIVALVLAGLSLVGMFIGFFVLLFVGAIGGIGESDKYGRVPIPGQAELELPQGEASVFYEEAVGSAEKLSTPRGLDFTVTPASGGPPLTEKGAGLFDEEINEGGTSRTNYSEIDVPQEGTYVVQTSLAGGRTGPMPALTFGEPLSGAIFDEIKYLWLGLLGLALAIAIAIATFIRNRTRHKDERVMMPPGGGSTD